jgi:hypothetical protein
MVDGCVVIYAQKRLPPYHTDIHNIITTIGAKVRGEATAETKGLIIINQYF